MGFAISDPSRTLARPLETVSIDGPSRAIECAAEMVDRLQREDDGLGEIVVGLPAHLDGTPTAATARVLAFVEALKQRTSLEVRTEDERLSSREAESRLAVRERDWRKRKRQLDAAAAAVILQDYLDRTDIGRSGDQ